MADNNKKRPRTVRAAGGRTQEVEAPMPTDTVTRRAPARGNPLATARERAGLTQQQLADELRVNRVTIARLEAGTRSPSMALALRIAKVLNESVDALFGGGR